MDALKPAEARGKMERDRRTGKNEERNDKLPPTGKWLSNCLLGVCVCPPGSVRVCLHLYVQCVDLSLVVMVQGIIRRQLAG